MFTEKAKKDKYIMLRVTAAQKVKVKEMAIARDMSESELILYLLEQELNRQELFI